MSDERLYVIVAYDVTGLDPAEFDALVGEALAQAERSDGHPSVTAAASAVGVDEHPVTFVTKDLVDIRVEAHQR